MTKPVVRFKVGELQRDAGVTVYALAKRTGLTQAAISALVSGKRGDAHLSTLLLLAEGLGEEVEITDLFDVEVDGRVAA